MSMFSKLFEILPDAEQLLSLEAEELAGPLLVSLEGSERISPEDTILYSNMQEEIDRSARSIPNLNYPYKLRAKVLFALMEAWQWLGREGFVAPRPIRLPGSHIIDRSNTFFVTRRGQRIKTRDAFESYRKADLLPKAQLHPIIVQKVWSMFLQGNYDPAVLQAFKEVEIAVRKAGNYDESDHGVPLMRQAFHVDTGKSDAGELTDTSQQPAEQEAVGHLFAGAMGYCRNPLGHREVDLSAEEAVEMIFFASYLLRIVDSRKQPEES